MKAVGIDIGTTTVCGIVMDTENGEVLEVRTLANDSGIPGRAFERLQDPDRILGLTQQMYQEFTGLYTDIFCVGLTGQMHGILYTDAEGKAVSPLYTWQDESGNEIAEEGKTYTKWLTELTGYQMAGGYGITTYFYHSKNGNVPEEAVSFCTIQDYIGMRMTGRTSPLITVSDAASFGCFDREKLVFDFGAIRKAGLNPKMLPECACGCVLLGKTADGIPVSAGIGDNQASVIGSVKDTAHTVLVNVGTGSQISVGVDSAVLIPGTDLRPLIENDYILVGAGLCGGRAYAALEQFLRKTIQLLTGEESSELYGRMAEVLEEREERHKTLQVDTRFCGTRENPELTGGIYHLTLENFTPEDLICGVPEGMADELLEMYEGIGKAGFGKAKYLVGSGNGIRKNPYLCRIFERRLGLKMQIPVHKEEAAYGAALYGMTAAGVCTSLTEAQQRIRYLQ